VADREAEALAGGLLAAHPGLALMAAALEQADPAERGRLAALADQAERRAGADPGEALRLAEALRAAARRAGPPTRAG